MCRMYFRSLIIFLFIFPYYIIFCKYKGILGWTAECITTMAARVLHPEQRYSRCLLVCRDVSFRNERVRRIETRRGLMRSGSRSCEPVVHLDSDGFASCSYSSFTNLHRSQTISFTCQPLSKGNIDGYIC